jgi:16S rRNA (adenine1518-N6/adenine1519-N6)-dimethyltransferase
MLPKARPADVPPAVLSELLAAAFSQRRKMLRGTLLPWLAARGVRAEMLEPTARPEDVPVEVYVELAGRLRSMSSSL